MPDRRDPASSSTSALTVAAVVGALACCAAPLLVAAGLLSSVGVLLDNLVLIALAAGVLGWAAARAIRILRARDPSTRPADHTDAWPPPQHEPSAKTPEEST